jgi:hypothetical protein
MDRQIEEIRFRHIANLHLLSFSLHRNPKRPTLVQVDTFTSKYDDPCYTEANSLPKGLQSNDFFKPLEVLDNFNFSKFLDLHGWKKISHFLPSGHSCRFGKQTLLFVKFVERFGFVVLMK